MADFKLLLDAQKETNKQLALLRQQQMQVAKDPPEKFTEGEEFKATALHIASKAAASAFSILRVGFSMRYASPLRRELSSTLGTAPAASSGRSLRRA